MIKEIEVGLIFQSIHARAIDKANVARIAESIKEVGLVNAICVRKVTRHRGTAPFDAYEIVGGHHRYEAAMALKWKTIRCEVVEMDDLHAELAEIDENLCRANLTPSQEAAAVARRKAVYERLHPETKAEANASLARKTSENFSFVSSTAQATGKNKRTAELVVSRGEKICPQALEKVGETFLNKDSYLDGLKRLEPERQVAKVEADLQAGKPERKSAPAALPPKEATAKSPDATDQYRALVAAWRDASEMVRLRFCEEVINNTPSASIR